MHLLDTWILHHKGSENPSLLHFLSNSRPIAAQDVLRKIDQALIGGADLAYHEAYCINYEVLTAVWLRWTSHQPGYRTDYGCADRSQYVGHPQSTTLVLSCVWFLNDRTPSYSFYIFHYISLSRVLSYIHIWFKFLPCTWSPQRGISDLQVCNDSTHSDHLDMLNSTREIHLVWMGTSSINGGFSIAMLHMLQKNQT